MTTSTPNLGCTRNRNRIPLYFLVQVCDNISSMVAQCQNAFPYGAWHLLERVAKPRDLTADLPANWHSRSHFETPRHSHNLFRSWPESPCACAGRSGRAAQRQPPVASGSTRLFVRFRALLGSTIVRAPALRPCQNGCKTSTVNLEEPDFRLSLCL